MSFALLARRAPGGTLTRRFRRPGWLTIAAGAWMTLLVLLAFVGPIIAPYDPAALDLYNVYSGPTVQHWLGTDESGRDVLSRLLTGIAPTLGGPLLVIVLATAVGTVLAVAAAWYGGLVDMLISRLLDILFSFPGLLVAIVAVALFGPGFLAPVIALSVSFIPVVGRVVRTTAIRERSLPYIAALQVQGASRWSICVRHIVPNLLPLIVVQATVGFSYALLDLAAISYLGLGLQPPLTDWGLMIATGQAAILAGHPQQSLIAAMLVVITVISMNLIGDALSKRFEVDAA